MSGQPMTPKGLERLHEQLRHLKEVERPKNVRDIEEARAHGDLRENAEYHAAREQQGFIEGRIIATRPASGCQRRVIVTKPCAAAVFTGVPLTDTTTDSAGAAVNR